MSSELMTINVFSLFDLLVFAVGTLLTMAFYAVYWRLGRRSVDLCFANILLGTTAYAFAALMIDGANAPLPALTWTRVAYIAGTLVMVSIIHFVFEFLGERDSSARRIITAVYIIGFAVAALTYSPHFLHARTRADPVRSWINVAPWIPDTGPLQLCFGAFWFSANAYAIYKLYRKPMVPPVIPGTMRSTRPLLIGFIVLMASGALDTILVTAHLCTISFALIGILGVCLPAGTALVHQILDTEMERRRLEEALRARDRAVREVAHELKGALTPIGLAASTLLERPERFDEQGRADLLNVIVDETQRLTRLINNMLDIARLEAGRQVELRLDQVDLQKLIDSVIEAQRIRSSKHRLEVQISPDIHEVIVDPDKVHQILMNLIDNAIKYSPDGGLVLVRVDRSNGDIAIRVSDEGIGMTAEQQATIFQPFGRAVDPSRKIAGTGIGLHLIKALVEAHGGKIWVESEYERGSTFALILPQQNGHAEAGTETPPYA